MKKKVGFDSIFVKRPTKCCCCIPLRGGVIFLCILLFINGLWNASIFFSEITVYSRRTVRGVTILIGFLFLLVVLISIFGIYVTRNKDRINPKLLEYFSKLFWISLLLLFILHLTDLILFFQWKGDIINACQNELSYLVPSNSSTVQVPFDPNAPTKKQVDNACMQAVNLSLALDLLNLVIFKVVLCIYFGAVVSTYSKNFKQITTEEGGKNVENTSDKSMNKAYTPVTSSSHTSSFDSKKGYMPVASSSQ